MYRVEAGFDIVNYIEQFDNHRKNGIYITIQSINPVVVEQLWKQDKTRVVLAQHRLSCIILTI